MYCSFGLRSIMFDLKMYECNLFVHDFYSYMIKLICKAAEPTIISVFLLYL